MPFPLSFSHRVAAGLLTLLIALFLAPTAGAQRKLSPGQVAQLTTINLDGSDPRVVFETTEVIEAPNWASDGKCLVYNSQGTLWRIPAEGHAAPVRINAGEVKGANNDHVLSPDAQTIYFSAGAHIYAVPFGGGQPRRVSNEHPPGEKFRHFLHGISPDGKTLAYVGVNAVGDNAWGRLDLYTIPAAGGPDTRLTDTPAPDDGPEYSPDGKWIYFNSELNAKAPGHAQIYRMTPDGSGVEQLTRDERVNWFPHLSPDGQWVVYISFPPGTVKHPADKEVLLRRMRPDGSEMADITGFLGGQGTINVNSWAPDSKRFAFVAFPMITRAVSGAEATPAPALKPPCRGLMLREFSGASRFPFIDSVVVQVHWKNLESADERFDGAAWAQIENARQQKLKIRLRILAGIHAPAFVKRIGGPGLSAAEHQLDASESGGIAIWNQHDQRGGIIPRFWLPEALDQYEQLMREVARRY